MVLVRLGVAAFARLFRFANFACSANIASGPKFNFRLSKQIDRA